ncbi:MAG: hypothetical protein HFJ48_04815 [Clostridia bacterium]|nr:hypothetical protein [Clostridia bacterium]
MKNDENNEVNESEIKNNELNSNELGNSEQEKNTENENASNEKEIKKDETKKENLASDETDKNKEVEEKKDEEIEVKCNKREDKKEKRKEKKSIGKTILRIIKRIIIIGILLVIAAFALKTARYYRDDTIKDTTNLVLNSNNVTAKLKEKIIVEDDIIYLSMKDIKNFLDYYIYEEEETDQIITTTDKKMAAIGFKEKTITVNGKSTKINATAIRKEDEIYLPISELSDVYNVDIKYIKETDTLIIDSLNRKQEKATITKDTTVKSHSKYLSRTVDKVKQSEDVIIIRDLKNGWTKVRLQNGKIGYVQTDKLSNFVQIRENEVEEPQVKGKISMFWDYYSESRTAPDRTGEKYQGINVVSPTFFYIDEEGQFREKGGTSIAQYVKWAKGNGYKVWPSLSNDIASKVGIGVTSKILNSYEKRQELIDNIIQVCKKYELDGINIDLEYIYEKDKDLFSRLIIELTPRMKELELVTSVDVTAPDGSPNWSLCYDRYVLGKIADYLVFMGYDQYGTSSKTAGTTAGYDWVETAINKFVTTYEVDSEKLILALPLYTRLWTETADGKLSSKAVQMKDIESELPNNVEKVWLDDVKQYYVEFGSGSSIRKMWIEDEKSIQEKLELVSKYNLAGVSCWRKGYEVDTIWEVIDMGLDKASIKNELEEIEKSLKETEQKRDNENK